MHCFGERQRTPPTQIANATHTDRERQATTKVDVLFDKS